MASLQEREWLGHLYGHEPSQERCLDANQGRHRVYIDLDHGRPEALEAIENSSVVPKPNYVLNSSPENHQVVWKVEGMNLEEAEGLLHAMAREFGGDPAATDATRVLRLPVQSCTLFRSY
jgi:hypothetical protein